MFWNGDFVPNADMTTRQQEEITKDSFCQLIHKV